MNSNDLCQKMRVSEKQFRKICQHLKIAVSDESDRTYTPREIQRLQHFVETRRSAAAKKTSTSTKKTVPSKEPKSPQKTTPAEKTTVTVASPARAKPEKPKKTEAVPAKPKAAVSFPTTDSPTRNYASTESASVVLRACAYIIDALLTLILTPFILIPILGQILVGILLACYWLFRDAAGSSPGKLILGLQIANNSDDPNRVGPRLLRNLPLSIGPFLFCIPIIGFVIGVPVAIFMVLLEVGLLLITGKRLGDRLGDTSVKPVPEVRLVSEP